MDSTTVAPPTPPRLSQRIVTLVGDARELLRASSAASSRRAEPVRAWYERFARQW